MKNLSPNFPNTIAPVRPGVYGRRMGTGLRYSRWDGQRWMRNCRTIQRAASVNHYSSFHQVGDSKRWTWFGLAEEPKA